MSSSDAEDGKSASLGAALPAGTKELLPPPPVAAVATATEELHVVGDDLDRLALAGAVGGLPLAPFEAAVDRDRPALREVLGAALPLVAPDGDVEVVGLVGPLSRLVLAARVHCYPQRAQRGTGRQVLHLGVARQVSDQDDAVDVGSHYSSSAARSSIASSWLAGAPTESGSDGPPSGRRVAR